MVALAEREMVAVAAVLTGLSFVTACSDAGRARLPLDAGVTPLDAATQPDTSVPDAAPMGGGGRAGGAEPRGPMQPRAAGTRALRPPSNPPSEPAAPVGPPKFPLQLHSSGRCLVDQAGQPFLINQASSWGLIQALSTADATSYLDSLKQRGFNTVMVSVISYDDRMAGDPPSWQGVDPFTRRWDFSTWNEAYFAHADEILRLALARDMLVTLVPAYLGYPEDSTQGWANELLHANNSLEKSRAYGRFLGERYASFPNILWIAGGDQLPRAGSEVEARLKAIVDGIRERDSTHLWTGHWDGQNDGSLATDNRTFAPLMQVNGYYAYNHDLTQQRDLEAYAMEPPRPLIHLDMSYETESGGSPDNIRRKAYGVMLNGGAGSSFNAGPDWYLFSRWRNMDTPGTRETTYWWRLFTSRPWYKLVPDVEHEVVTGGFGELGSTSYVSAALSQDGRLLMAYLPRGAAISVDLGRMAAERVRIWWYDPTSGGVTDGGEMNATGVQRLSPPARRSWLLVIDDAALGLAAPGG